VLAARAIRTSFLSSRISAAISGAVRVRVDVKEEAGRGHKFLLFEAAGREVISLGTATTVLPVTSSPADGPWVQPDALRRYLTAMVKVEIRLGPEYDVYPPTTSEPLIVVEDPVTCARIVDALQDDGLEHDVVLQAHGSLSLVCYEADDEFLTTVTVLPGWIRYGAPDDSRLATDHLMSLLEELGVSHAFSRTAWQAVDDVEPRFPAATRKNARRYPWRPG
jgi:hypothetical protein